MHDKSPTALRAPINVAGDERRLVRRAARQAHFLLHDVYGQIRALDPLAVVDLHIRGLRVPDWLRAFAERHGLGGAILFDRDVPSGSDERNDIALQEPPGGRGRTPRALGLRY